MQKAVRPAVAEQPPASRSSAWTRILLRTLFVLFYVQSVWELAKAYLPSVVSNVVTSRRHKSAHRRHAPGLRGWLASLRDSSREAALRFGARLRRLAAALRARIERLARAVWARLCALARSLRGAGVRALRLCRPAVHALRRVHAALKRRAFDKIIVFAGRRSAAAPLFGELHGWVFRRQPEPYMVGAMIRVALLVPDLARARSLAQDLLRLYPENFMDHQQAAIQFFISGHYDDAEAVWIETEERREAAIRRERLHLRNVRLLGPSWLLAIGHIAHIDIYLKRKILTGRTGQRTVMVTPWHIKVPNRALLECWRPYIEIPETGTPLGLNMHAVELLQDEFWSLRLGPRNVHMFSHAGAIVQREWDKRGYAPLLSLDAEQERRGSEELRKAGIDPERWFVCLHVREPGFHRAWHKTHPGTRNADVSTYLKAVRSIVERGGQVVRMGDPSMKPLPRIEGLFDYAHSSIK
ncbi:MAG TPA: TIGR04372 family glycosyltransferase, partial [Candidatus Binataceae bacterium]|nr:TIGR04372 family glycosyltransferase [Candidatus Binataceae bacterium]